MTVADKPAGIPTSYLWPGMDAPGTVFYLTDQSDCGATQTYMVMRQDNLGQHIMAERCYLPAGQLLVDALRYYARRWDNPPHPNITSCPACGAVLVATADNPFSKPIGVKARGVYDGTLYWQCPYCTHKWNRWPADHRLWAVAEREIARARGSDQS